MRFFVWFSMCAFWASTVAADGGSLFRGAATRVPLIGTSGARAPATAGASLFAGQRGVLAPIPKRQAAAVVRTVYRGTTGPLAALQDLVASAEAGPKGYDAVQYGARIKPPSAPTTLKISEIYGWISATPGQPHAIGRYQFIPATLKRLVKALNVPTDSVFTPALQDRLAERLFQEAGLNRYRNGDMGQTTFMNNLAKIWAGLPTSDGKSHYHGLAGNRATMNWSTFQREMKAIFGGA